MADYKYVNPNQTGVIKIARPEIVIFSGCREWDDFLTYIDGGGEVEPWRTVNELRAPAQAELWAYHDSLIDQKTIKVLRSKNVNRHNALLNRALRKEAQGQTDARMVELLEANDILAGWFDEMETAAEVQENWIEAPERTAQELIAYDPATAGTWPDFPQV